MPFPPSARVLIYGYGIEGKSTKTFLNNKNVQNIVVYDEHIPDHQHKPKWQQFDHIVVSAGINRHKIPENVQKKCTSNTELFFQELTVRDRKKIIGITGTKGKSMTTKLTHETLLQAGKKAAIGGNFGVGLLDLIDQIDDLDFVVIELSSYQLKYLKASIKYALCTNLYEDHLDWHGSEADYHESKSHLWGFQQPGDTLLVPQHQASLSIFQTRGEKIPCPPAPSKRFPKDSVWQAEHHLQNFGLIQQLIKILHIDQKAFQEACMALEALPHRMEYVGTFEDIDFYDDAISTNPRSLDSSIKFFDQKLGSILIGGQERFQDFQETFQYVLKYLPHLHIILLPSEIQERLSFQLSGHFAKLTFTSVTSMHEAVKMAYHHTPPGKISLLSPAAPSYDHYQNYTAKGKDFQKWIRKEAISH